MDMSTTKPPKSMTAIHTVLNALSPELRNQLLSYFANDAFVFDNVAAEQEGQEMMAQKLANAKIVLAKSAAVLTAITVATVFLVRHLRK
jgi:hypothetical protein